MLEVKLLQQNNELLIYLQQQLFPRDCCLTTIGTEMILNTTVLTAAFVFDKMEAQKQENLK